MFSLGRSIHVVRTLALFALFVGCSEDSPVKSPNSQSARHVVTVKLPFDSAYLDLDTHHIQCCPGQLPTDTAWDIHVTYAAAISVHSVIIQNFGPDNPCQIAHLFERDFDSVTPSDTSHAEFTANQSNEIFRDGNVILIKNGLGTIYKLGNPVETASDLTFDYVLLTRTQ